MDIFGDEKEQQTAPVTDENILKDLPKDIQNLYHYSKTQASKKTKFNSDGSVTFYPTDIKLTPGDPKKFTRVKFTKSKAYRSILKGCNCKFSKFPSTNHEAINDLNTEIIEEFQSSGAIICPFITCAIIAWSNHFPLKIKPEHIWLLILQSTATHVEQNAEKLRNKYVKFKGKKELKLSRPGYDGSSASWNSIINDFVKLIDKNTVNDTVKLFDCNFSQSNFIDKLSTKITIMDICKSFFDYKVYTLCGFPSITLTGNKNDWLQLKIKTTKLLNDKVDKKFGKFWGECSASIT